MTGAAGGHRFESLDGLRGLFLMVLVVAHLGLYRLAGAWILLSAFFLVSGFLITTILLREHARTGTIRPLRFYRRRAERLIPGLMLVLVVVGGWALLFASDSTRRQMRGDLLATAGFVQNWRLIHQNDQYFGQFEQASFFRHAWTLAVEEQFYVVAPLLFVLLLSIRSLRWRLAILLAGAFASAWLAASIGVATLPDQARVYYGTDTRLGAILVGVALAFAMSAKWRPPRFVSTLLAPVAFVILLVSIWVVAPMSEVMFERGGLLAFSLVVAVLIIATLDPEPNPMQRFFATKAFVWCGVRIYGIYLWHWPIKLWIERAFPEWNHWTVVVVGTFLTLVVSAASFRWIERPVTERGLRGILPKVPGFVAVLGCVATVMALSVVVGRVDAEAADPQAIKLVEGTPDYVPAEPVGNVAVYGDSVTNGLFDHLDRAIYSDISFVNLAVNGCGLSPWAPQMFNTGPVPETEGCPESKVTLRRNLESAEADALVIQVGSFAMLPHWDDDGSVIAADDPRLTTANRATLDSLYGQAVDAGVENIAVVTVPCRGIGGRTVPDDKQAYIDAHPDEVSAALNPVKFNDFLKEWANDHEVEVLDLYAAMGCDETFDGYLHGVDMYKDFLHFSDRGSAMVWTWLAPTIRDAVTQQVAS